MKRLDTFRTSLTALVVVVATLVARSGRGESLAMVAEYSYAIDRTDDCRGSRLSALLLGGDSVVFTCGSGLYARFDKVEGWRKLVGCVPAEEEVPFSICDRKELTRLIMPMGLLRVAEADRDVLLVFEYFCGWLYALRFGDDGECSLKRWKKRPGRDHFDYMCVQDDLMLGALRLFSGDKALALQQTDGSDYVKVWEYPSLLARRLDSVGLSGDSPTCTPAFNPRDSTLWLAIDAYDYLYVTDMKGHILDSLPITAPDYRLPSPLKSRIKSSAVFADWYSQWTPVSSFIYVPGGYFLLQYHVKREESDEQGGPYYSTLVWNDDGEQVSLDVDKNWRLAAVQPDGRLVFGQYDDEGAEYRVILSVVRIVQ